MTSELGSHLILIICTQIIIYNLLEQDDAMKQHHYTQQKFVKVSQYAFTE
jgi:hypothetical protein